MSAGYHLKRRGFTRATLPPDITTPRPATYAPQALTSPTYLILDAEESAGGAWLHRPDSLTMTTLNGIFDLPQFSVKQAGLPDVNTPANQAVPQYFAAFEQAKNLGVVRPVTVSSVEAIALSDTTASARTPVQATLARTPVQATSARTPSDPNTSSGPNLIEVPGGLNSKSEPSGPILTDLPGSPNSKDRPGFRVRTSAGTFTCAAIINATGTWNNPVRPHYPGMDTFAGVQLHSRDVRDAENLLGPVGVVGGGISAVQLLEQVSRTQRTAWYTRRPPEFLDTPFRGELEGRETIRRVTQHTEAGGAPRSIVSFTALPWTDYARAAWQRGALKRRPMFTEIKPKGVVEADGSFTTLNAIVWATGYRPALKHLAPLRLENAQGGIPMDDTRVRKYPNLHLVGYGPSQSTVGANRFGWRAALAVSQYLKG
ncbi:NAD(P)-binding domain-containing protein [Gleimia hominis]|uniref:NAD(P)-binding domain-containing protein n=1 Tax=Gleimia hominis TaxID=595468 RepID=A0ABU3I9M0_9ACTO|nr:NAD(P)-binding domain-containing protein [Gleimia hominis]MDT3767068.1 NAD(P)-binding domain-containing protein [Gleimia hominis]